MINRLIAFLISSLLIFTPIAFGAVELWAFSLMELGILLMVLLWAVQLLFLRADYASLQTPNLKLPAILFSLFILLVLFQMLLISPDILRLISPQTQLLRLKLQVEDVPLSRTPLSFVPFLTQIELLKWITLIGFFLFLLRWSSWDWRIIQRLILVVFCVGVFESLYGMFEFFSGHKHILHLKMDHLISSVTGTFINRNAFAGYLLMVIPLSMGYLFFREPHPGGKSMSLRHRFSSLDGKSMLIAFGIILMVLGLLFSASRMGIVSLLLSFTVISILFRQPSSGKKLSQSSFLILGLALLWAVWIGLDAVVSRFFTTSESFEDRWMIWVNTSQIIRDFPLFGSGLGTFAQVFPMYRSFHIRGLVTHAENDFLQLVSEVGLIGAGLLLILFLYFSCRAISGIRSLSHRDPERYIGMGGMIGIFALMFHSLVERTLQIPANAFLFIFIWSLVLRAGSTGKKNRSREGAFA